MKQHICFIYVLFDKNGKVNYVGRTQYPRRRSNEHCRLLGFRPMFRIIDSCSDNCRNVEKQWIGYYRERGFVLRNIAYGQGPHFLSAEGRKKLSLAFKGRPVTWGDKISASTKGIPKNWSAEGLEKLKRVRFKPGDNGWDRLSDDAKARIINPTKERWKNPELRARMLSNLKLGSAWRTREEQDAVNKKISKTQRNDPRRKGWASMGGIAVHAKHPNLASSAVKTFWRDLKTDPARYREFVDRRTLAIAEAKRKKQENAA